MFFYLIGGVDLAEWQNINLVWFLLKLNGSPSSKLFAGIYGSRGICGCFKG